jgi:general secretion pathway protein H
MRPRGLEGSSGFTLVEILVVLVLIGITVGMVTLSVGSAGDRQAELEVRRLAALVDLASDEAVLKAQEIGIRFRRDGYEFYTLNTENVWEPLQDEVLRVRTLPQGFELAASSDGVPFDLDEKTPETLKPHGFFLSSGERSAVEVELGPEHGARYRIVVPIVGDLVMDGPHTPKGRS